MRGVLYCSAACLERALIEVLRPERSFSKRARFAPHRIPLGLILLSRQQLTTDQLRTALQAQRAAGSANPTPKKIGEWLQEFGFVTEQQVTVALARQWSCPVLRNSFSCIPATRLPAIPALLLESFQVMPVELVEATGSLLMAFGEGIDYSILYAIEQMLGYHTQPCLVRPSVLRNGLLSIARHHGVNDVVFDCLQSVAECAHIIGNYTSTVRAEEVRLARCGEHLWVRLERPPQEAVTLVMRAPRSSSLAAAQI
ncbi:MAG: hypothetical protein ACLQLC_15915 [Candidatus Sulfotelmatobacter sp.]